MIDFFEKIYLLNLDRDKNRLLSAKQQLDNSILKNNITRFTAVDGRYIDINSIPDNIISDTAKQDILQDKQRIYGVSMTYGSLGCAISHWLIFKEAKDFKKPIMVFEDDIILNKNFDSSLKRIILSLKNNKFIDFDMVYLGYHNIPSAKSTRIDNVLSKPSGLICGTYGYILSPLGASKLLSNIFPLTYQIDSSISHNLHKLNVFSSTNHLLITNNEFISNAQQDHSCYNIYRNNPLEDNWSNLFI